MDLSSLVNLSGGNLLEIVMNTPPASETTNSWYTRIRTRIAEVMEPQVKEYLNNLKLSESLQDVKTVPELEAVIIEYSPLHIKEALAVVIDEFKEELSDGQRIYLLTLFIGSYYEGAAGYCNQFFKKRAQEILQAEYNQKNLVSLQ